MGARRRIGVMVPSTNTTCEADFQLVVPPGITVHGQRLWLTNDALGEDGMVRMNAEIETGARYLATARVDVISYGCTTGSFFKGPGWDQEMIQVIRRAAGVPAVATSPSVVEALRAVGARRLSVATPYPEWNNVKLRAYLESMGFEVLCRPEADALLCSCTAWRSVEAVAEIERRIGKPVVTSNQAAIWASLRILGVTTPISGFGQLLQNLHTERTAA
jgi:maleate cis-trans isomerase